MGQKLLERFMKRVQKTNQIDFRLENRKSNKQKR